MLRRHFISFGARTAASAALTVGFATSALATPWVLELVDAPFDVGGQSSVAADALGRPSIAYTNSSSIDLKFAWRGDSTWTNETVDAAGDVGGPVSLALDAQGSPRISYHDGTNVDLKYASKSAAGWTLETVDAPGNVGLDSSIELDAQGNPRISYALFMLGPLNADLKYAAKAGGVWNVETVVSQGVVGEYTSLELDAQGNPRITYFDRDNGNVWYAAKNGGIWTFEIVETQGGAFVTSLALDPMGNPHVCYYSSVNEDLRYAVKSGGIWIRETVEAMAGTGINLGLELAVDAQGKPHIGHFDNKTTDLEYAVKSGGLWRFEVVDSSRGWFPSFTLDAQSNPHFSYYSLSNGNLRYAGVPPSLTNVPQPGAAPTLLLSLPWPNPASTNGALSMRVDLPRSEQLTLEMFDVSGRRVAAMPAAFHEAGQRVITWRPPNTPPGVYVLQMRTDSGLRAASRWTQIR
jgi:hypothetical protein